MKMMRVTFLVLVLTVLVLLLPARPAYAYLDPGSGSMFVQLLLGGVAGAVVILRLYWNRLLALFGLAKPPSAPEADKDR
jgi:hypothetical protein